MVKQERIFNTNKGTSTTYREIEKGFKYNTNTNLLTKNFEILRIGTEHVFKNSNNLEAKQLEVIIIKSEL